MSGAAAAAAARMREMLNNEEEELSKYSDSDLNNNWEFKIVRSMTGAFRNLYKLNEVIENERKYGWQFLEKFDNHRIRFKRIRHDGSISYSGDPYKIYYGMTPGKFSVLILLLTFLGTGVLIALIFSIVYLFK